MNRSGTSQLALFADPGDQADRDAIAHDLAATLFVEAGAGTGKTKALVDRVVALVTGDGCGPSPEPVEMRAIAAITFTEKAAAELRDRVRRALQERAADPDTADVVRQRCAAALDDVDAAAICTLHAFAQRILGDFPVEAGLPPRVEVRDEISSRIAFDTRWRDFLDELLDDPELEPAVLLLLAAGVTVRHLRTAAEALDDNWDLLDRVADPGPLPALDVAAWLDELDAVCASISECRGGDDSMVVRLGELAEYRDRLRAAFDDAARVELLKSDKPSFKVARCGRSPNWTDLDGLRNRIANLGERRGAMVDAILDVAIRRMVAAIARCTERAVEGRRASGRLDFHDLLVLARALLRDPEHGPRVRQRLRERYRRILVDEFQDTDPIQVELATLLGSADPADGGRPWDEMAVEPGRLFFVGDPKQSIYRFRRADIATFLAASARFGRPAPRALSCNFRTAPAVLRWVNHVFGELIRPFERSQPEYRPLEAARRTPEGQSHDVVLLGSEPHPDPRADAATLRAREAADVAAVVRSAIEEQWPVFDRALDAWRPARLGDICILLPARTSLGYLETALDAAEVPFRAETSSLVYGSREVRDLLMTLRAVDDPSDALALVSALRSSVFGCGDDDLFRYKTEHGGRFDLTAPVPGDLPDGDPVGDAMRFLADLHAQRSWLAPSELLERVVRERGVVEVGALTGRFRDVARRVRFVVDQARAYADAAGGTLRDYLAWTSLQAAEGARVVEAVVPETDDDAVRIMTVHGAKGLEFPIVVCSGMTTAAQSPARGMQLLFPPAGGYELRFAPGVQTAEFELHKPIDEQMSFHEKLRLLYVACTRARDHLVVSVHRKVREREVDAPRRTHAELVWDAAAGTPWRAFGAEPVAGGGGASGGGAPAAGVEGAPPALDPDTWQEEYERAHRRADRRGFVSPTTLAHRHDTTPPGAADPGLEKEPRDLELPPWNKGRYGTAIGRAVHGALQTVDLGGDRDVAAAAAAQAAAEGVLGHEPVVEALTRAALASPTVQRAAAREHWRETYVAVPLEGIALEGYVDLVFRDDDGLVVVDYKTDTVDERTRAERAARYRIQVAAYALAISEATGERVTRAVLCFLDPNGATEIEVAGADLASAVATVQALIAAERDEPSPRPPPLPEEG